MLKQIILIFLVLLALVSCSLFYTSGRGHGFSHYCYKVESNDTGRINAVYRWEFPKIGFVSGDTIVSIGVGSGWREFLYSLFADDLTFYMEDLDTSCITQLKIKNDYLPHYTAIRNGPITCRFIPVRGTLNSFKTASNMADKVIMMNVYHHFGDDIAMIEESKRVLKSGGKLIIMEHVLSRNRRSHKFCTAGGRYKTENRFRSDIEAKGFSCDTVYRNGKYLRLFVFVKP